jgi:hypothetical protein
MQLSQQLIPVLPDPVTQKPPALLRTPFQFRVSQSPAERTQVGWHAYCQLVQKPLSRAMVVHPAEAFLKGLQRAAEFRGIVVIGSPGLAQQLPRVPQLFHGDPQRMQRIGIFRRCV